MASGILRRVRASKAKDEDPVDVAPSSESEEGEADSEAPSDGGDDSADSDANSAGDGEEVDEEDLESLPESSSEPQSAFAEISFGALASAQESLGNKRKRGTSTKDSSRKRIRSPSPFHEADERRAGKNAVTPSHRSSKHAPTELSSKKAVSRKRSVVPVPSVSARDPRFSAISGPNVDTDKLQRNYSFLNDYRESEIAGLKTQLRDTRDPAAKEALKRQIRPMEDRERARKRAEEEKEVVQEHKRNERDAVKEGKTPYFLKKGEIKKQVLVKRFEGMGEKKVEKVMERRRKKKAGMAKRALPMGRRGAEED